MRLKINWIRDSCLDPFGFGPKSRKWSAPRGIVGGTPRPPLALRPPRNARPAANAMQRRSISIVRKAPAEIALRRRASPSTRRYGAALHPRTDASALGPKNARRGGEAYARERQRPTRGRRPRDETRKRPSVAPFGAGLPHLRTRARDSLGNTDGGRRWTSGMAREDAVRAHGISIRSSREPRSTRHQRCPGDAPSSSGRSGEAPDAPSKRPRGPET